MISILISEKNAGSMMFFFIQQFLTIKNLVTCATLRLDIQYKCKLYQFLGL